MIADFCQDSHVAPILADARPKTKGENNSRIRPLGDGTRSGKSPWVRTFQPESPRFSLTRARGPKSITS